MRALGRWGEVKLRAPLMNRILLFLLLPLLASAGEVRRYLYVASPGIRDYLEHGGHGVLVFDVDDDYKFVRRIPSAGLGANGAPMNVKGVCASAALGRLYVSTLKTLLCFDLTTDKLLWEKPYEGGCDRMAITPDGKTIYLPSLEGPHWHVVNAETGDVQRVIKPDSGAHNTVASRDGREVYLAGLRSPLLTIVNTADGTTRTCGPFTAPIRPFTVNKDATRCYVCLNELLGFETGDLKSGKKLHRVEVAGFHKGPIKRHGCPSHGAGLTPDGKELWLCDAANQSLHLFDVTKEPPVQLETVKLRDEPGWVTFTLDGKHALPSTGEVIDVKSRKIVSQLTDEEKRAVMSEKMVEVHFKDGKVVATGDQFGVGR
jgi:DNA-binding beta-propeller fold protein YncE